MKKVWIIFVIIVIFVLAVGGLYLYEKNKVERIRKELYDANGVLKSYPDTEKAVAAFRSFSNKFYWVPFDKQTLPYHIEAGELAWTLGKMPLSLDIFMEVMKVHPKNDMTPYLYLRVASIANDAMKDTVMAREYYTKLLDEYPKSEFAEGARFGIETLGMNEEEQFLYIMRKGGHHGMEQEMEEEPVEEVVE